MDRTGPVEMGNVCVLMMVTLSSVLLREFPCWFLQVMELRGRLNPEMDTVSEMFSPGTTSNGVLWLVIS